MNQSNPGVCENSRGGGRGRGRGRGGGRGGGRGRGRGRGSGNDRENGSETNSVSRGEVEQRSQSVTRISCAQCVPRAPRSQSAPKIQQSYVRRMGE